MVRLFYSMGIAVLASAATSAQPVDACPTNTMLPLPSNYGLDGCVGENIGDVLGSFVNAPFQCSLPKVLAITKSEQLLKFVDVVKRMTAKPEQISAILYDYMKSTGDNEMKSFCTDWNTLVSPCASVSLSKLMAIIHKDTKCCGQVSDLLDLLNLIVPPTISKESFVLTELINGVNSLLCATRQDTKQHCGTSIFHQITNKYTAAEFRLVESLLLPFFTASPGQECQAFQGFSYVDSAASPPVNKSTIDYGCCVNHMRPIIETMQNVVEYATGTTVLAFLNGIIKFPTTSVTFVDAVTNAKTCVYRSTCSAPAGLIEFTPRVITPGTNRPPTNILQETLCTRVKKCDGNGTICSEVCEKGSVSLPSWVASTLKYQRRLAYSGNICYAQIPATHNSAINLADGYGNRDQLMNLNLDPNKQYSYMKTNNQVLSVPDLLNLGIRWLEIDVHFFLDSLRTAHCGGLGSHSMEVIFQVVKEQLSKYGAIVWSPELVGCFPSLSGIRAEEQRTTRSSMEEIRKWLDRSDAQDEIVFVYLDTGVELVTFNKMDELNTLLTDVFGNLLVTVADLDAIGAAGWHSAPNATLQKFIDQGRRVVVMGNQRTKTLYKLTEFCKGHKILSNSLINAYPDPDTRMLGNVKIYGTDYFVRSFDSALRYISITGEGQISRDLPDVLNATNVANYVRWNANLIATDSFDGATAKAQIWSWSENEPRVNATANTTVFIHSDGRWRTSATAPKKKTSMLE